MATEMTPDSVVSASLRSVTALFRGEILSSTRSKAMCRLIALSRVLDQTWLDRYWFAFRRRAFFVFCWLFVAHVVHCFVVSGESDDFGVLAAEDSSEVHRRSLDVFEGTDVSLKHLRLIEFEELGSPFIHRMSTTTFIVHCWIYTNLLEEVLKRFAYPSKSLKGQGSQSAFTRYTADLVLGHFCIMVLFFVDLVLMFVDFIRCRRQEA
ncbi:hypothetical protein SDJN03_27750, partial [Cucurbita argyrosperma subsp. sororia]